MLLAFSTNTGRPLVHCTTTTQPFPRTRKPVPRPKIQQIFLASRKIHGMSLVPKTVRPLKFSTNSLGPSSTQMPTFKIFHVCTNRRVYSTHENHIWIHIESLLLGAPSASWKAPYKALRDAGDACAETLLLFEILHENSERTPLPSIYRDRIPTPPNARIVVNFHFAALQRWHAASDALPTSRSGSVAFLTPHAKPICESVAKLADSLAGLQETAHRELYKYLPTLYKRKMTYLQPAPPPQRVPKAHAPAVLQSMPGLMVPLKCYRFLTFFMPCASIGVCLHAWGLGYI